MKIHSFTRNLFSFLVISCTLCSSLLSTPFNKGYKEIVSTVTPLDVKTEFTSQPNIPHKKNPKTTRVPIQSNNWCGYLAASNLASPVPNTVTAVYGSWIVPDIKRSNNNRYCSIWIGMDGYFDAPFEQIGTRHNYINGEEQHSAWFQVSPGNSFTINSFPVNPGDVISASVEYSGNNTFTLVINNDTQMVSFPVPTSFTQSSTAPRASAAWIIEAPDQNGTPPLANFNTIYRWGCIANIDGILTSLDNDSWQNTDISMVMINGNPKATASTILQDNGSFFATWEHQ